MGCQTSHVRMTCEMGASQAPAPNVSALVPYSMGNDTSKADCEDHPIEERTWEDDICLCPLIRSPPNFGEHYLHVTELHFFLHYIQEHAITFEKKVHKRRHELDGHHEKSSAEGVLDAGNQKAPRHARKLRKGRCPLVPQHTSCACVMVSTSLMSL